MKKLRWQIFIVLLALAAIAVLLLGRQPVIQSAAPEPVKGGVYTEALIGQMGRLNPVLDAFNAADREVNRLLYSSMLRHDSRGLPQPDLAESWGISKDGTVYNFALRNDIYWHDGEPVTSTDIEKTILFLQDEDIPLPEDVKAFWNEVEVKALDPQNIQFVLPEPYAPFLDFLTFGVLPAHLTDGLSGAALIDAAFNLSPVGSGPYRFERFLVEDGEIAGVVLTASEIYYVQRPFIDQIVFRYYPDAQSAMEAYQEGEVLGIGRVPTDILDAALREPNLNVYSGRLPQFSLIFINLDSEQAPFLQDPQVRQALMLGLNRQKLIDRLLGGQAIIADGPIFPATWAYFDGIPHVDYDPDEAVQILKNAGYVIPAEGGRVRANEDGALAFELLYPDTELGAAMASEIQESWARIGVAVDVIPVQLTDLIGEHLSTGNYAAALVDLDLSATPDPDPYLFWHQTQIQGGQNYARWDDRQVSEYLEQARVTLDLEERSRLYRNFQVLFGRELPALPLFYPVYTYAVDNQIQGIQLGPLYDPSDRFASVHDWFLLARAGVETTPELTVTP